MMKVKIFKFYNKKINYLYIKVFDKIQDNLEESDNIDFETFLSKNKKII
jgi:hypothetical protein